MARRQSRVRTADPAHSTGQRPVPPEVGSVGACTRPWATTVAPASGRCASGRRGGLVPLALIATLLVASAARADVSVRATLNPRHAQVGEPLSLTIEINGAQNVSAPALGGIDGFDAQYTGPSTQVSIVNGQVTASVQHRYALTPLRPGHFTLGPFVVEYQSKQYQTPSFSVDITAAGQPVPAPQVQPAPGQRAQDRTLYATLSTAQTEVYLHQRIAIDVQLYIGPVRVNRLESLSVPADGLSMEQFPQGSQRQEVIGGQTYTVAHFQTTAVPLRTGSLTLGPATLRVEVLDNRRRGSFNDPFFNSFFQQTRSVDVRSDPLVLTVLPLPEEGKPPGFSGAVGTFAMNVTAAPTELNAGDPITLRMEVTGNGNLTEAQPPTLTNAESFRTYEPRANKAEGAGRSFEQVLIPNDAGVRAIPVVRFSYFDPQARRYQTLESQPIALVVRPPQNAPGPNIVTSAAPAARSVADEKLGRDIVYIKDDPGGLVARSETWYGSLPFLLWQPVPLLLFGAAVWYDRRRQRLSGDVRYARFTRAGKQARRALAAAEQALALALAGRDRARFYDTVSRTMQEYLGAKLDLPPGGIDAEAVTRRGVPEECAQRIRDFFATCEQVRFAPGAGDGDMRGTLALARAVIKRLERERRLAPAAAGTSVERRAAS